MMTYPSVLSLEIITDPAFPFSNRYVPTLANSPLIGGGLRWFTFTVVWASLYLFDTARRQRRNGWAWMPLLLIFPTIALFLFTLTSPTEPEN